jgi:hypothetical protein
MDALQPPHGVELVTYPVDGFTLFSPEDLPGWLAEDQVYLLVVRDGLTWAAEATATADPLVFLDWHWGSVRLVHGTDEEKLPLWIEPDPVGLLAHLLPQLGLDI